MSVPIAVIVGLGLLGVNLKIRQARIQDDKLLGPFIVFFIVFVFSFISNTNAFYSRLIENDIVQETQNKAWLVFEKESSKAAKILDESATYQTELRRIAEVETETAKLKRQITDPLNPGRGERAQEHLQRIEELLETSLTDLRPPPNEAPMSDHESYALRLENLIYELVDERSKEGVVQQIFMLENQIGEKRATHRGRIDSKDFMRKHTDEMHRDLKEIQNLTNRILSPTPELILEEINDEADDVGKFKYTWRNFVNLISPVAMVLSIILGALLDVLAPTMSLALYRPQYE